MTVAFQCSRCQEALSAAPQLVGHTILCPLCEERLVVPPHDPQRILLDQELATALEYFKLTDWDRAYARKLLELGILAPPAIRKAVVAVRNAARAGRAVALNDELLRGGLLDHKTDVVLREVVKGTVQSQIQQMRSCPKCFSALPASAKACAFCGFETDDLALQDTCPNCLRRQPAGGTVCRTCGADMETGLKPGKPVRCPGCGYVSRGGHLDCPKCRTALDRSPILVTAERWARAFRRSFSANGTLLFVLLLAIGGYYTWREWPRVRHWVMAHTAGEGIATLEDRVAQFGKALKFNDLPMLTKMVDPVGREKMAFTVDAATRACMLGVTDTGATVASVSEITPRGWILDEAAGTATVYAEVRGELAQGTAPDVTTPAGLQQAAVRLLEPGTAAKAQIQFPWRWIRRSGIWYYSGPLPGSPPVR